MAPDLSSFLGTKRYAVVTGANKGIGLEICRQLASHGVTVILTARDEKRGLEAVHDLYKDGASYHLCFHRLDVRDSDSVAALAEFVKSEFGKLDILVNNAGIAGVHFDVDPLIAKAATYKEVPESIAVGFTTATNELSEECIDTNFYGAKRMTEALLPLLQLSDSARIVNVSSSAGKLTFINNPWAKGILSNTEDLTEEKLDEILTMFFQDFKEGLHAEKGWPTFLPAYIIAKSALNAYTRLMAKRYPLMHINCVHPGFVRTDMSHNIGNFTPEEGASSIVRLVLAPEGATGLFFWRNEVTSFE